MFSKIPIWCAPTGSIAGPELCAAVASAGGVGAMGITWTEPQVAQQWVREVKTNAPEGVFQVNFALAFPPNSLETVLDAGVPLVTFSWGDAKPYIPQVHASGARVGMQITSVAGAKYAQDIGVDFLICQGIEAGGHVQSTTPLFDLLTRLGEAGIALPCVAAGGISTREGVQKALTYPNTNICGVMMGTRFVATAESRAHLVYKQALLHAHSAADTALTICFDVGWPHAAHRVLRNSTLERWEATGSAPSPTRPGEGETIAHNAQGVPLLRYEDTAPRVGMTGDLEAMCLYAGCGVGDIKDIPTASEVIQRLL